MHISLKYTLFYNDDSNTVWIDNIITSEQAHKKYGKISMAIQHTKIIACGGAKRCLVLV